MATELKEQFVCFGPKQNVALISSTGDIIFYLRLSLYNNGGDIYLTLPIFRCLRSMFSHTVPPFISVWIVLQTTFACPVYNQANEICVQVGTEASQAGFFLRTRQAWMLIIHKTWGIQYTMCAFLHFQFRWAIRKAVDFSPCRSSKMVFEKRSLNPLSEDRQVCNGCWYWPCYHGNTFLVVVFKNKTQFNFLFHNS